MDEEEGIGCAVLALQPSLGEVDDLAVLPLGLDESRVAVSAHHQDLAVVGEGGRAVQQAGWKGGGGKLRGEGGGDLQAITVNKLMIGVFATFGELTQNVKNADREVKKLSQKQFIFARF